MFWKREIPAIDLIKGDKTDVGTVIKVDKLFGTIGGSAVVTYASETGRPKRRVYYQSGASVVIENEVKDVK